MEFQRDENPASLQAPIRLGTPSVLGTLPLKKEPGMASRTDPKLGTNPGTPNAVAAAGEAELD